MEKLAGNLETSGHYPARLSSSKVAASDDVLCEFRFGEGQCELRFCFFFLLSCSARFSVVQVCFELFKLYSGSQIVLGEFSLYDFNSLILRFMLDK